MAGHVYMNLLSYYRNMENSQGEKGGAFDVSEGLAAEHVELLIEASVSKISIPLKDVTMFFDFPVFCCSRIRFPVDTNLLGRRRIELFDPRMATDFVTGSIYEYSVLLMKTRDFKNRFEKAAEDQNIQCEIKPVNYEDFNNDPKYADNPSAAVFRKSSSYSYQKECRAVLYKSASKAEDFYIGDLSDISILLPASILTDELYLCSK